ncbi:hypothetical protein BGX28_010205 [Mortierella sp. GBA30]|nr:hypothetical protein BGX28_010205 [Mortierella sp. GBA30]
MSKNNPSRKPFVCNEKVRKFYERIPEHARQRSKSLARGKAGDRLSTQTGAGCTAIGSTRDVVVENAAMRQADIDVHTPVTDSSFALDVPNRVSEIEKNQRPPKGNTPSSPRSNNKPIPRREFKAIKKKLQKRERKRLAAATNTPFMDSTSKGLSMSTSMPIPSPLNTVFSIPELADGIAQYLRPSQLLNLRTVSKTFFQAFQAFFSFTLSSFLGGHESRFHLDLEVLPSLASRVHTFSLELHGDQEDPLQRKLLDVVYSHCSHVQQLKVQYWAEDLAVLEALLLHLPRIQRLSVLFMASTNATAVFNMMIARSHTISEQRDAKVVSDSQLYMDSAYNALQYLKIKHVVTQGRNAVDRMIVEEMLQAYKSLRSVSLNGILITDSGRDPATSEHKGAEYGPLPSLETLKLSHCHISAQQLQNMNRVFPNLKALKIRKCDGTWQSALLDGNEESAMASSIASPDVSELIRPDSTKILFPELRKIVLWEYHSSRTRLLNLVAGRPHLSALETDLLPDTRDGIFELARYCSGLDLLTVMSNVNLDAQSGSLSEFPSTAVDGKGNESVSDGGQARAIRPKKMFKRLAVQTYMSPTYSLQELEQFYGAVAFSKLEYVLIQTRELSMSMFPFAKTLRELALGGPPDILQAGQVANLNQILRQLPLLEVLRIDRWLDSYEIFDGLGDHRATLCTDMNSAAVNTTLPCPADWLHESPFLVKLNIFLRAPHGHSSTFSQAALQAWKINPVGSAENAVLNLDELERQVLDRFRFLEELTVHIPKESNHAPPEMERWKKGRATRCVVHFKCAT